MQKHSIRYIRLLWNAQLDAKYVFTARHTVAMADVPIGVFALFHPQALHRQHLAGGLNCVHLRESISGTWLTMSV